MRAAIRLSSSLRPTRFLSSTRIRFSDLSPQGITASSSPILHQDPNSNSIPAATVLPSSFFLTHHPFEFQGRFSSRKYFSLRSEKAPNVNGDEDENPTDDGTCCQLCFTRKVYRLLGFHFFVTATFCSAVLCNGQFRGLLAVSPSIGCTSLMTAILTIGAQFVYEERFPLNFMAFGIVNLSTSLYLGAIYAIVDGGVVLASVALTAAMASSLTAYAFWTAKKGHDFKYLYKICIASGVIFLPALFVRPPPGSTFYVIGVAGGVIFWSASIALLSSSLLKDHYHKDDCASPSPKLYITLLNLFFLNLNILYGYIATLYRYIAS